MSPRRSALSLLATVALVLAACGGDDDTGATDGTESTTTEADQSPSETTAPTNDGEDSDPVVGADAGLSASECDALLAVLRGYQSISSGMDPDTLDRLETGEAVRAVLDPLSERISEIAPGDVTAALNNMTVLIAQDAESAANQTFVEDVMIPNRPNNDATDYEMQVGIAQSAASDSC